jgi:hypothetical protein
MGTCPLFPLFNLRQALKVWQENYCESSFERCARYKGSREGKVIPMNMLPNGKMLAVGTADPKR